MATMTDRNTESAAVAASETPNKEGGVFLRGRRLRDEFICPITCELLREPVVASDGHTYEKEALKRWMSSRQISPRNGAPITQIIIDNLNLKKLIVDYIDEGGAGLYTADSSYGSRVIEVKPEKMLVMKCIGPPENEWHQKSMTISRAGCIGGRSPSSSQSDDMGRDIYTFRDLEISRRHFEVAMVDGRFSIRDLGSGSGTFIRVNHGQKKTLYPGMILKFGKHQFIVSSASMPTVESGEDLSALDEKGVDSATAATALGSKTEGEPLVRSVGGGDDEISLLVSDVEDLLVEMSSSTGRSVAELAERLQALRARFSETEGTMLSSLSSRQAPSAEDAAAPKVTSDGPCSSRQDKMESKHAALLHAGDSARWIGQRCKLVSL
jgi:U-box domain/FHA domain